MTYTFVPKENFAKASSSNMRISTKAAVKLCKVIRGKKLDVAKRLLFDLANEKRDLDGKHYTKTAKGILALMESCEKNATFAGLDSGRMFVHASAHMGNIIRRRRRKSGYGSRMKSTNLEIMLIEKGLAKEPKGDVKKK
jgi:ribosomal protein L22